MLKVIHRKNRGLSEVVTTLILLVVGVLLAAVVTYYATNITMTRTQMEEVRFSKEHVWVNETGAVAGFKLQNLGGRDILMDKFSVRSVESHWSNIYIYRVPSGSEIFGDVNVTSYARLTGASVMIDGHNYTRAVSDVPLVSGGEVIVYVKGPENISLDDLGTTVSISCTTNNAEYITECNVESATEQ
jgi:flagellin-like protein